jgi:hypothetical protein
MDFECIGIIGYVGGGGGPFTVAVGGYSRHFDPGQTLTFPILGRRCNLWIQDVRLFDDASQTGKTQPMSFDPASNGGLFPGGACTLP